MDINETVKMPKGQTRFLSPSQRLSDVQYLPSVSRNGTIARGHIGDAALRFSRSIKSIRLIWQRYIACRSNDEPAALLTRPSSLGRRPRLNRNAVRERIRHVPMLDRMNMRSLAASTNTALYMAQRLVAEEFVRRKTTGLHPLLNADQEHARLRWILSCLQAARNGGFEFVGMNNVVHVDEKWFYEDSDSKSFTSRMMMLHPTACSAASASLA